VDGDQGIEIARTRLPHVLAALYGVAIVYASLEPFSPWLPPPPGTPFFLFGATSRFIRYDALLNVLAYVPFGLFLALSAPGSFVRRIASATLVGAAMSFAMESLQMYVPPRIASPYDLATNTLGALLGGGLALPVVRSPRARRLLYRARDRWFLSRHLGDVGLGLLLLWLVAQTNPGIPLFGVTFDADAINPAGAPTIAPTDAAGVLVQAAGSAFQVLGVGLFVALLLRRQAHAGTFVTTMILGALLLKTFAAALMLKPAAWQTWVKLPALAGIAIGALLLRLALALPRPVQVALCAVAVLSALGAPLLAPETLAGRAPVTLFEWQYGQLLNYNGLTRSVLLAWPIMTAVWLFALAGRPAWGKPVDHA
jgi:VanZ family protein